MEAAVHLRLREQPVRHGDVYGEGVGQHRLLQEGRLHSGTQSETQRGVLGGSWGVAGGSWAAAAGFNRMLRPEPPLWTQIIAGRRR